VPFAERDMFFTFKSSTNIMAWLLLIVVDSFCKKSRLQLAILVCILLILSFYFLQFCENLTFLLNCLWRRCNFFSSINCACFGVSFNLYLNAFRIIRFIDIIIPN